MTTTGRLNSLSKMIEKQLHIFLKCPGSLTCETLKDHHLHHTDFMTLFSLLKELSIMITSRKINNLS